MVALVFGALLLAAVGQKEEAPHGSLPGALAGDDDECGNGGDDGECAWSALQRSAALRGERRQLRNVEESTTTAEPTSTTESTTTAEPTSTTEPTTSTTTTTVQLEWSCLCAFDVDRTLTTKQAQSYQCPGTRPEWSIWDSAYGGGPLSLSEFGAAGLQSTFCRDCYVGIITAGDGTAQPERAIIDRFLAGSPKFQQLLDRIGTRPLDMPWRSLAEGDPQVPIVIYQRDGTKQIATGRVLDWYGARGIGFHPENVHFFDDRADNVQAFAGTGYNARQISCESRDGWMTGIVGFCGARLSEIVSTAGVVTCEQQGIHGGEHMMTATTTTTTSTTTTSTTSTTTTTTTSSTITSDETNSTAFEEQA